MTPNAYCQQKVAQSGWSFSLAFLKLTPQKRQAMNALYAFCREADDAVDDAPSPSAAKAALEAWQSELDKLYKGAPSHLVTQALLPVVADFSLPKACFDELLLGMAMDIEPTTYPDFAALRLYCYRAAGVVGLLSARIFGFQNENTLHYAEHLGIALQLTNILRDLKEDKERARDYLPSDELLQFSLSPEAILSGAVFKEPQAFANFLTYQIQRAEQFYDTAFALLPKEDKKAQSPGLFMAEVYRALLRQIAQKTNVNNPFFVLKKRARLTALQKLAFTLKALPLFPL